MNFGINNNQESFGLDTLTNTEQQYALLLRNRIIDSLLGKEDRLTNEDFASGMFLHCLIVALERIRTLDAELGKINKDKLEEKEFQTVQKLRLEYNHRHQLRIEEEDEDDVYAKMHNKQMKDIIKAEVNGIQAYFKLFDPQSLLEPETAYTATAEEVVKRASDLTVAHEDALKNTTKRPRP